MKQCALLILSIRDQTNQFVASLAKKYLFIHQCEDGISNNQLYSKQLAIQSGKSKNLNSLLIIGQHRGKN